MFARFPLVCLATCSLALSVQAADFALGVDVFLRGYTHLVKGHRVGLLTNQTGKNAAGVATIDLLYEHPQVDLRALFSPEHGIRGKIAAGKHIKGGADENTGLPIHSLYGGDSHRPPKVAIDDLDVIVYDIQDVGSRAYTYIWSLAEAMAAMGEQHKTIIVLDRPSPLTVQNIDGPVTEPAFKSFLGLYPIPRVYGATVGEIARYFNNEHDLGCKLIVIPMAGYRRDMTWDETGLKWIGPSPNIPTVESAICFGATGTIGEVGCMNIGIGTRYPFQIVGAPWMNAERSAAILNSKQLPGVVFQPTSFTMPTGPFKGQVTRAVFLRISDVRTFLPATTELVMLDHLQRHYAQHFKWIKKHSAFDRAMGTDRVRISIEARHNPRDMLIQWQHMQRSFRGKLIKHLIYQ
jgi:uncharacterized protein YbbC (DUF1343 family)